MIKSNKVVLSTFLLAILFSSPVSAEETWKHTLAPLYLWASGIEGTSQVGPIIAPVSIEFEDALDNLDSGLTVHYEANKDQWGVLADIYHISLAPEGYLPNGVPAGVDLTNNIYEVGGIYRPEATEGIEVLFGLRGMDLQLNTSVGPAPEKTLIDEIWWDGFVGLRGTANFTDKLSLTARGDIGAGGSDFVGNASVLLNYRFNKTVAMFGGYRWLTYDYESGTGVDRFAYDVTYQGPAIALRFDW